MVETPAERRKKPVHALIGWKIIIYHNVLIGSHDTYGGYNYVTARKEEA